MPVNIEQTQSKSKKWGLADYAAAAGTIGAVAAAVPTGGASLLVAPTLAAGAATVGAAAHFATKYKPLQDAAGAMIGGGEASAMARMAQQKSQDNLQVLKSAEAQLPRLSERLRQEYGPPIIQARMLEERKRGIA